jgi:hypothetical protein
MAADSGTEEALGFLFRHLVAICITYRLKTAGSNEPSKVAAFSGTLLCVENTFCVLTAGHCIASIEGLLDSENVDIVSTVLADTFSGSRISDLPIPFDIRNAPRVHIDDAELGLDFGLIALHQHYVRLLATNGTVALFEENWARQHQQDLDVFLILGFPDELALPTLIDGAAHVTPSLIRVVRSEAPAVTPGTKYDRFVGKIEGTLGISSIVGMSGGPILGFNTQRPHVYWVVAIQSTWLPQSKIVYGCPLPTIGRLLKEWMPRIDQSVMTTKA